MRLQKVKDNKKVQHDSFLDYIDCGGYYLLTDWFNTEKVTVTLNKDTVLEDLCKKHGGDILYTKFCNKTFRAYRSMSGALSGRDKDKVINSTEVHIFGDMYDAYLLKSLMTGEERPKELSITPCIVRWANEERSRGTDWYRVPNY